MYVMMSVVNLGEQWSQRMMLGGGDVWAKEIIEEALDTTSISSE